MDGESILTWNVPNWVTVVLMVALGMALLGFVSKWFRSRSED
jgi:hypothetical protein